MPIVQVVPHYLLLFMPICSGCDRTLSSLAHQLEKLIDCISVLFVFHRLPIEDEEMLENLQIWTERMVCVYTLMKLLVHVHSLIWNTVMNIIWKHYCFALSQPFKAFPFSVFPWLVFKSSSYSIFYFNVAFYYPVLDCFVIS